VSVRTSPAASVRIRPTAIASTPRAISAPATVTTVLIVPSAAWLFLDSMTRPALEVSRSGVGAHAWVFFTAPVPAELARRLGTGLLREAMALRGRMRRPAGDAERRDVHLAQRQPGRHGSGRRHADRDNEDVRQAQRQVVQEEPLVDERDARGRDAQPEEDHEPGHHPRQRRRGRFGRGEDRDLHAGRADQAHRRELFLAASCRQPGRRGDEDQHRRQDGQRHDGQDQVGGSRRGASVPRLVGQALGVGLKAGAARVGRRGRGDRRHLRAIRDVRQLRRGTADDDDQRVRRRQRGIADHPGQVAGVAVGPRSAVRPGRVPPGGRPGGARRARAAAPRRRPRSPGR
jgi:hypothetical protein